MKKMALLVCFSHMALAASFLGAQEYSAPVSTFAQATLVHLLPRVIIKKIKNCTGHDIFLTDTVNHAEIIIHPHTGNKAKTVNIEAANKHLAWSPSHQQTEQAQFVLQFGNASAEQHKLYFHLEAEHTAQASNIMRATNGRNIIKLLTSDFKGYHKEEQFIKDTTKLVNAYLKIVTEDDSLKENKIGVSLTVLLVEQE